MYVDETGDRGMTPSASPFFIVSAVMVRDDHDADLRALRDRICTDMGKPTGTVLHWAENLKDHSQRKHVALRLGAADFMKVAYVIVHKAQLQSQHTALRDPALMYNYAIRRLLERVTWCIDDRDGEAILTFAHIKRFPYAKLTDYVRTLRQMGSGTEIRWNAIRGSHRIDQPSRVHLLQVADIAAGCLGAAVVPDRFGNLEPAYLASLVPRIYARPPGAITSYGMNVVGWGPDAAATFTGHVPWWSTLFG